MHKRTTLLLVLVVAVLAVLVWRQLDFEEQTTYEEPLFEEFDPARVALRIDHLERGTNLKLQRDSFGGWYLTDPISYPADEGLVRTLLNIATHNRVRRVPRAEARPEDTGLSPPRAVLELIEPRPEAEGGERRQRVEIGLVDLDGSRLFVRTRGEIWRTSRNLDTTLDRGVSAFRSKNLVRMQPQAIVQLSREGLVDLGNGQEHDVALTAVRAGQGWRVTQPAGVAADPGAIVMTLQGLAGLQVEGFVDDDPQDLTEYGLDPPTMRLDLLSAGGDAEGVLFGTPPVGGWYAKLAGAPHVFSINENQFLRFAAPAEFFFDHQLLRVRRSDVLAVRLERGERTVRLVRDGEDWAVTERAPGEDEPGRPMHADDAKVDELLTALEQVELSGFPRGAALGDVQGGVFVETPQGVLGGEFGAEEDGARRFRRQGDAAVATVAEELFRLTELRAADFRSLELLNLDEIGVRALTLRAGERKARFQRDRRGLWVRDGEEQEAQDLLGVLDSLLFLRAGAHLDEVTADDLEEPLFVEFLMHYGGTEVLPMGVVDGAPAAVVEGRVSTLARPELLDDLRALLP